MVRSGKLLGVLLCSGALLCSAVLAGCSASPTPAPTPAPVVATCPDGLSSALEAHLAAVPVAGQLPVAVTVDEFPDLTFSTPVVTSIVGCVFTTDLDLPGGERMSQIFGIADGLDEAGVVAVVEAAGWEQPFPDTEPGVWQDPANPEAGVSIYPRGVAERPALKFPDWAQYLGPDEVLLLGTISI